MSSISLVDYLHRKRHEFVLLLLMSLLYAFSYFQRVAVPSTIFDELQMDLSMSAAAVATMGAFFLYPYGGMQVITGILADRFGGARVIIAGGFLLSMGSLLFPLLYTIPALYLCRALTGLGASLIFVSIFKELDTLFEPRQLIIVMALSLVIGYAGGLLGTFPFERVVEKIGWRPALLVVGVACLITLGGYITVWSQKKVVYRLQPTPVSMSCIKSILVNPRSFPLFVCGPVNFAIYFLLQAMIGKKLLEDCCRMSSASAASVMFGMMLASISFVFITSFISRVSGNRRKPVLVFSVLLTLASVLLIVANLTFRLHPLVVPACFILLGVSSSSAPVFNITIKEVNLSHAAGTSLGLLNTTCYLSVAILSNVAGIVMDCFKDQAIRSPTAFIYPAAAYQAIFAGLLAMASVSFIACLFIREPFERAVSSHA